MKRATPFPFLILVAIAVGALALPALKLGNPKVEAGEAAINTGNTAWMLTASALVLLMTPGLSFFYGGTVVHMSAGFAALAGAMLLGRRKSHLSKEPHSPANIPFVILGTGMLWFGWFGFNAGSALAADGIAAKAFATTNTASAAAMLGWMFFDWMRGLKPSALGACIGAVVGLVAITPAAGFVTVPESISIGLVASVISNLAVHWKTKSTLDDTLDVFPCHGVGGMVGMIATGIFAADVGLTSGKTETFINHMIALVIVAAFSFFGSIVLYKITDLIIPLRVTPEQEEEGLDLSQHGETALGAEIFSDGVLGEATAPAGTN